MPLGRPGTGRLGRRSVSNPTRQAMVHPDGDRAAVPRAGCHRSEGIVHSMASGVHDVDAGSIAEASVVSWGRVSFV